MDMSTKPSKKSLAKALARAKIEDFIIHATDDELENMKTHIEEAKNLGVSIYGLKSDKLPMVLYLIQESRLKSIQILAKFGLNLHAKDNRRHNALHYCAQKSNEYLSFFIQQGVSVHQRNDTGYQPLAVACCNSSLGNIGSDVNARISNIKSLLEAGADINDANPVEDYYKGLTALQRAIAPQTDWLPILDFLLQQPELEIHKVNERNDSALHCAVAWGNIEMTRYLINTGRFDLEQMNDQGFTAMDVARRSAMHSKESEKMIAYLTPIYVACAERRELSSLLSVPASVRAGEVAAATETGMAGETGLRENRISGCLGSDSLSNSSNFSQSSGLSASSESSSNARPLSKPRSL